MKNLIRSFNVFLFLYASFVHSSTDVFSCSKLIPDNHSYVVTDKYDITRGQKNTRTLSITDKSQKEIPKKDLEKLKPFINCVKKNIS
ncbi:hypothetical protein QTV06_004670 [Enterobacter ludwigii]|nr:hypothetical protein [Enterobacter ludwigii]ELP5692158.1 hypothetical protein [Enterobacter ludwigii]